MKFLKKVLAAVACVCVLATSVTLTSHAAGGRISFADPSTAVGDMVDVKCVLKSKVDFGIGTDIVLYILILFAYRIRKLYVPIRREKK